MERKIILGGLYTVLFTVINLPVIGLTANRGPETTPPTIEINLPNLKYDAPKFERKPDALDSWLLGLKQKECAGCKDGFKRIDSNGLYSYSCLQFQKGTWDSYSKALGFSGDINACADQMELARLMILDDWNNWSHWYNSVVTRHLGFPPNITQS